ncbi:MAG TPA: alkaline phosphatase family protein [Candidatus Cybelea sp.]|nr:alkaline phosphatase family protein [Candidatus Cybelea sp.]
MRISTRTCALIFCGLSAGLTACNGSGTGIANPPLHSQSGSSTSSSPIDHVVIIVQENRTFNDFFATFPGADGTTTGGVVKNMACKPKIRQNRTIALKKSNLVDRQDMNHSYRTGYSIAYDGGKLDAFDVLHFNAGKGGPECLTPYQYTDPMQIQPYWQMATQYTLAEHMFTTQGSDSFTAHQDLIAGGTVAEPNRAMIDLPGCGVCMWGCDAPPGVQTHLITAGNQYLHIAGPFPCTTKFTTKYPTLRDLLDAKSLSWKYYVPPCGQPCGGSKVTNFGMLMNAFDVIAAVRNGPEWGTNVVWPETTIFNDIASNGLPAVSWVIPIENNSDHPGTTEDNGPSWVASIVNAIGESSYWDSTAIVVLWDDWGGFYDNAPPPQKTYGGLGFRVPAIIISPYARAGYISTTQYEFGSILRYIEDNWDLGRLGTSDKRATSIIDSFDYSQYPIKFKPIQSSHDKSFFLHEQETRGVLETD